MIHATAIIHESARLGTDVEVGPFSVIGADVEIGAGSRIGSHTVIQGPTRMGRGNQIYPFASVGEAPQDKKYRNESTRLEIGDENTIREYCTINRGTEGGGGVTRIGDRNWIMAYVHIAHDCQVGNDTVFANGASLAGHVRVDDHVILGGFTLVHQFCAIGRYAFTAFDTGVARDIPPYVMTSGSPAEPHGINVEGLKRHGFAPEVIRRLRQAYKILYRSNLRTTEAIDQLEAMQADCGEIEPLVRFLRQSERGIVR